MRELFRLTDSQYQRLLDAGKPVPYLIIGGVEPRSPQENANMAWQSLGNELGFVWDTVRPVDGESDKVFTAEKIEREGK